MLNGSPGVGKSTIAAAYVADLAAVDGKVPGRRRPARSGRRRRASPVRGSADTAPSEVIVNVSASRSGASVDAIREAAERLAALAGVAPDPDVPIPHSGGWTLRDVLAHLVTVTSRYTPTGQRASRWADQATDVAALNDEEIHQQGDLAVPELLQCLRAAVADLAGGPAVDDAEALPYTGGVLVRPADLLGLVLGEFVVHGHDIAKALNAPWPIQRSHAAEVLASLAPIMPAWVDPDGARGLTAAFEVRIRGDRRYRWQFTDGRLVVSPATDAPVDVTLSADPVALLLTAYRRVPLWRPIIAGQMRAWGRRPLLAFRINSYFRAP
jgi:uncharacterized protein (TIGR03083 family)